jgi:hypothetical protein
MVAAGIVADCPRTKRQFYAALEVDNQQALYDKEQLIGSWMDDYQVSIGL